MNGVSIAVGGGHIREIAGRRVGDRAVVGLSTGRHLDLAGVRISGVDVAADRDRSRARIEPLEPVGGGNVGLGRDRSAGGCRDRLVGVQPPIPVELVESSRFLFCAVDTIYIISNH